MENKAMALTDWGMKELPRVTPDQRTIPALRMIFLLYRSPRYPNTGAESKKQRMKTAREREKSKDDEDDHDLNFHNTLQVHKALHMYPLEAALMMVL